jgi:hypothetical protein
VYSGGVENTFYVHGLRSAGTPTVALRTFGEHCQGSCFISSNMGQDFYRRKWFFRPVKSIVNLTGQENNRLTGRAGRKSLTGQIPRILTERKITGFFLFQVPCRSVKTGSPENHPKLAPAQRYQWFASICGLTGRLYIIIN